MAQSREIEKLQRRWQENPLGLTFAPLAEAYRKEGMFADALELLEIGLSQHPNYVPAHIVRGRCQLDVGADAEAEGSFLRVVELDLENVIALKGLAEIAERAGRFQEAASRLERLLSFDRNNEEARLQLDRVRSMLATPSPGTIELEPVDIGAGFAEPSPPPPEAPPLASTPEPAARAEALEEPAARVFDAPEAPVAAEPEEDEAVAEVLDGTIEELDVVAFEPAELSGTASIEYRVTYDETLLARAAEEADAAVAPEPTDLPPGEPQAEPLTEPEPEPPPEAAAEPLAMADATPAPPLQEPAGAAAPEGAPGWAAAEAAAAGEPAPEPAMEPGPETPVAAPDAATPAAGGREAADGEGEGEGEGGPEEGEAELVVTETMAEVFLRQGHRELALAVYTQLAQREADNPRIREAIERLGAEVRPASAGLPAYAAALTGGQSVRSFFEGLLSAVPPGSGPGPALGAVFGDEDAAASDSGGGGDREPSYDEFFAEAGRPGRPAGAETSEPGPVAPAPAAPADDIEEFNAWLRGLKR